MKAESILLAVTIAICLVIFLSLTVQNPTVEMTSDSMGSKLVSTDYLGNKTTCVADVMPGGTIVSRCY